MVPIAVLVVGGVLALACASAPPPAPVVIAQAEVPDLAGEWWGEYSSASTGWSGRIRFSLSADGGEAYGYVLMIPWIREGKAFTGSDAPSVRSLEGPHQVIPIFFVSFREGIVYGSLTPYPDPECHCLLTTTFIGEVRGDVIEGQFTSTSGHGHPTHIGRWWAKRRNP